MYVLRLPSGLFVSSPMTATTDNPNLAAVFGMSEAFAAAPMFGAVVTTFSSADLAWRAARAAAGRLDPATASPGTGGAFRRPRT